VIQRACATCGKPCAHAARHRRRHQDPEWARPRIERAIAALRNGAAFAQGPVRDYLRPFLPPDSLVKNTDGGVGNDEHGSAATDGSPRRVWRVGPFAGLSNGLVVGSGPRITASKGAGVPFQELIGEGDVQASSQMACRSVGGDMPFLTCAACGCNVFVRIGSSIPDSCRACAAPLSGRDQEPRLSGRDQQVLARLNHVRHPILRRALGP